MKYKRLLLKLSGESLAGETGYGIHAPTLSVYASVIGQLCRDGHEVGVVVGGGNFWRGRMSGGMDRMSADKIGMLATVMNGIALDSALLEAGVTARLMSAVPRPTVGEPMNAAAARRHWSGGGLSSSREGPAIPSSPPIRGRPFGLPRSRPMSSSSPLWSTASTTRTPRPTRTPA